MDPDLSTVDFNTAALNDLPTSTDNLQPLCRRHHKAPDLDWEYGVAC